MSIINATQLVVGIVLVVGGMFSIYDCGKSKQENERNRFAVFRVAFGVTVMFAGIIGWGINTRWEKVKILEGRISALEAQLAKQPATQNTTTEQK